MTLIRLLSAIPGFDTGGVRLRPKLCPGFRRAADQHLGEVHHLAELTLLAGRRIKAVATIRGRLSPRIPGSRISQGFQKGLQRSIRARAYGTLDQRTLTATGARGPLEFLPDLI